METTGDHVDGCTRDLQEQRRCGKASTREQIPVHVEQSVLEHTWADVGKEAIDYGIMENAREVAVVPVQIGWNDIGSWQTLMELLDADAAGNVLVGDHIAVDTRNTLVYSPKKLVATVGLEDLIVVETDDALLICPRDRAQDVRSVVDALRKDDREDLL